MVFRCFCYCRTLIFTTLFFFFFFLYPTQNQQCMPLLSTCFPLHRHRLSEHRHRGEPISISQQPVLCSTKSPSHSHCFPLSVRLSSGWYYLHLPPIELYCTLPFQSRFFALLQTPESAPLVSRNLLNHLGTNRGHWILYPTSFLHVDCEWFYLLFLLDSVVYKDMYRDLTYFTTIPGKHLSITVVVPRRGKDVLIIL